MAIWQKSAAALPARPGSISAQSQGPFTQHMEVVRSKPSSIMVNDRGPFAFIDTARDERS
jgi:hypothetical protein